MDKDSKEEENSTKFEEVKNHFADHMLNSTQGKK